MGWTAGHATGAIILLPLTQPREEGGNIRRLRLSSTGQCMQLVDICKSASLAILNFFRHDLASIVRGRGPDRPTCHRCNHPAAVNAAARKKRKNPQFVAFFHRPVHAAGRYLQKCRSSQDFPDGQLGVKNKRGVKRTSPSLHKACCLLDDAAACANPLSSFVA